MEAPPDMSALTAPPLCISRSYAWEIVKNKRDPSRALAIRIFRKTGWRHTVLEGLTDPEIDLLERIETRAA